MISEELTEVFVAEVVVVGFEAVSGALVVAGGLRSVESLLAGGFVEAVVLVLNGLLAALVPVVFVGDT